MGIEDRLSDIVEDIHSKNYSYVIFHNEPIWDMHVKVSIIEEGEIDILELLGKYVKTAKLMLPEAYFTDIRDTKIEKLGLGFTPEEIKLLKELE